MAPIGNNPPQAVDIVRAKPPKTGKLLQEACICVDFNILPPQNAQKACYILLMKNIAILSLSLVALSGGAGLGLSALHEFNMNVQTSALSTPDNIPSDSGFVIPDYVPDAAQFAAFAPSLQTPTVFEAPALEPVQTAALGDTNLVTDDIIQDEIQDEPVKQAVAVPVAVERRTGDDAPKPQFITARRPAAEAPVFIAQAPSFLTASSSRIDYVIGVYR